MCENSTVFGTAKTDRFRQDFLEQTLAQVQRKLTSSAYPTFALETKNGRFTPLLTPT